MISRCTNFLFGEGSGSPFLIHNVLYGKRDLKNVFIIHIIKLQFNHIKADNSRDYIADFLGFEKVLKISLTKNSCLIR